MNKLNTTEEAVAKLKNEIKTKVVEPIWVFWSEAIALRTKIILLVMATIFMFGLLVYSLFSM